MKICIICVEKKDYAPKRLFDEGKKMGHSVYMMPWNDICVSMDEQKIRIGDRKRSLGDFDAIIQRSPNFSIGKKNKIVKKLGTLHKLIIEFAKKQNIAILNDKYFSGYQSLDKMSQQYFLFDNNLPGIPTKYFSYLLPGNVFPMIVKTSQGSLGKGVFKVKKENELKKFISLGNSGQNFIYQKYFPIICDYRALVIQGKLFGVIKRISSKNEWRTNVSLGGIAIKASVLEIKKIRTVSEKVAKKMRFDYVGVDLLESDGDYKVIEVNSLAQFEGFEKAYSEMNVARAIIALIENKTKKLKSFKKSAKKTNNKRR